MVSPCSHRECKWSPLEDISRATKCHGYHGADKKSANLPPYGKPMHPRWTHLGTKNKSPSTVVLTSQESTAMDIMSWVLAQVFQVFLATFQLIVKVKVSKKIQKECSTLSTHNFHHNSEGCDFFPPLCGARRSDVHASSHGLRGFHAGAARFPGLLRFLDA